MAFSRGCLFACRADGWQAAMYMPYQTLEVSQDRADVRAAHSDVGPGPFIDWVRYSLWGSPCVMSQRSRGMLPSIYHDRACPQHHGDKTRDAMQDRWGLGQCWHSWWPRWPRWPGERARSLVQCAAFASCESGNYQLTFLHRLTLFKWVRSAKRSLGRGSARHLVA